MEMIMEMINCLDLKGQHEQIKDEVFEKFEEVYSKTAFAGGPFVAEFEKGFAEFCQTKYAIGVNSGTSSLHLAMRVLKIGQGDEVIVPANTFIASVWAISYVGATPVFVDCKEDTWEIDHDQIEEKITSKTKAVIGVHLYGQPFEIEKVKKICDQHSIHLIEDAAQAHGATFNGTPVGGFGELACFSFYPGKNLGACGEGGGLTTNNEQYYSHLQSLRNHGSVERYYHDELGYNMRMGGLEGASLSVKLKYITGWNNRRIEVANRYLAEVNNPAIKMQAQPANLQSVHHLFVVTAEDKEGFVDHLRSNNINPGFHYPVPCHLQKAYLSLGHKEGDFPHSEYLASHCVSLPMYAELNHDQVEHVINVVNQFQ